jgi:hypothetical protein
MFTDDNDIERELRGALGAQPSDGFERRVLDAVEQDRTRQVPWTWLGAAAAAALAAGLWLLSAGTTPPAAENVVSRVDPPVQAGRPKAEPASAPADGPVLPPEGPRHTGAPRFLVASRTSPEPEILVPANQLALIDAFAREIHGGRVRLPEEADADERLRLLTVPDMTVQPIAIATLETGVSGPGSKGLHQ